MRRALVWTLAAAGVLLALLWLAFEPPPASEAPHPAARAHAAVEALHPSTRVRDSGAASTPTDAFEPASRTPAQVEARAESAATLGVRVLDGGGATAGAQVWLFAHERRGGALEPASFLDFANLERQLELADATRICDPNGRAHFPQRVGSALVIARAADGRVGWNVGPQDAREPLEIRVVRDFDVDVLVRERDGSPVAGVPVVLRRVQTVSSDYLEQRTDSEGRATLRCAGALLSRPGGAWFAQLGFASTEVLAQRVDLGQPPRAPLEFTLPPRGSVELVLSGRDGAAASSQVRAMLRSIATSPAKPGNDRWPTGSSTPLIAAANERVLFEHVALGCGFDVTIVHPLFERKTTFTGPKQPGERVVVRVGDCPGAAWTARVLDEQGQPWRGELVVRASEGSQVLGKEREIKLTPRADGLVRVEAPQPPPLEDPRVLVFVTLDAQGREVSAGRAQVRTVSAAEDLGDVILRPVAPLASGWVLDWRGRPVSGARVTLVKDDGTRQPAPLRPFATHSDGSGQFELQFAHDAPTFTLQATAAGRASEIVKVGAGAREVRLALAWGGEVRIALENVPPQHDLAVGLQLALTPAGARFDDLEAREIPARSNRSLRVDNVPAGEWDLVIAGKFGDFDRHELARVRAVARVDEQRSSVDAGSFDVGELIQPIVIRASALESNVRWFGFTLSAAQPSAHHSPAWSIQRAGSTLLVPAALAPFDLRIDGRGLLDARFESVRRDLHVQLRPAPWIELVLDTDAPSLPEDRSYCAAVTTLTSPPSPAEYQRFDADGRCRVQAQSVGPMRIALGTCSRIRWRAVELRLFAQSDWPQIEVSEFGPQRVLVLPTGEAVDAALSHPDRLIRPQPRSR